MLGECRLMNLTYCSIFAVEMEGVIFLVIFKAVWLFSEFIVCGFLNDNQQWSRERDFLRSVAIF